MLYAIAGAFLLGCLISGFATHSITSNAYLAEAGREARKSDEIFKANNERIDKLANELEVAKNVKNVEYQKVTKYITKYVERPAYQLECIDDDGLRAVNSVISGGSFDPGEPSPTLPARDTSGGKDRKAPSVEIAGTVETSK